MDAYCILYKPGRILVYQCYSNCLLLLISYSVQGLILMGFGFRVINNIQSDLTTPTNLKSHRKLCIVKSNEFNYFVVPCAKSTITA